MTAIMNQEHENWSLERIDATIEHLYTANKFNEELALESEKKIRKLAREHEYPTLIDEARYLDRIYGDLADGNQAIEILSRKASKMMDEQERARA